MSLKCEVCGALQKGNAIPRKCQACGQTNITRYSRVEADLTPTELKQHEKDRTFLESRRAP
jgi:hypothetical protein